MAATANTIDPRAAAPSTNTSDTRVSSSQPLSSSSSVAATTTLQVAPYDEPKDSDSHAKRGKSPVRGRPKSTSATGPRPRDETSDDGAEDKYKALNGNTSRGTVKKAASHDNVQRLSASEMHELTSSPDSLPIAPAPPQRKSIDQEHASGFAEHRNALRQASALHHDFHSSDGLQPNGIAEETHSENPWTTRNAVRRPWPSPRTLSTPPTSRAPPPVDWPLYSSSPRRFSFNPIVRPNPNPVHSIKTNGYVNGATPSPAIESSQAGASGQPIIHRAPTPMSRPSSPTQPIIPVPPMSLPTHLQLELAAQRPSPLYIHQSHSNDIPYESSAVKFERLKNVLLIPTYLERTLYFGALACLDAWLYTFTILPVRFILALTVLVKWWAYIVMKEVKWLVGFVWTGIGRLRQRSRSGLFSSGNEVSGRERIRSSSDTSEASLDPDTASMVHDRLGSQRPKLPNDGEHLRASFEARTASARPGLFHHRRTKSTPSTLSTFHKADLLQGAVIICSSLALMTLDASRMYHFIRAQSAIKLYVIYNILEVGDRLLSALGQDILECLFSNETLSRNSSGRSKILLPLGMFLLALGYNCLHSIALYYQVITLNVAVNSYSNALLTLLLSNQFVEIKSTVFKRFEKDNLFQLTCADIVERFHLWIMLLIIGMRNVVEVGGLSVPGAGLDTGDTDGSVATPLHHPSILPHSFTVLPSWIMSGEVLSPFLIVIGSEMLVDTIKHAYVTKFNNIKPSFYARTLDILCKDYYTNAFVTPTLTRRLGLAVIPLSCLFIRASIQTYHMFLSTHLAMPLPQSTQTSLTEESAVPSSPAMMAALNRFDTLIRDSLGRATYGYPYGSPLNSRPWYAWTSDDFIAALTMVVVFFIVFLVLLILKLLLGMLLLHYARNRYAKMKHKEGLVARGKLERETYDTTGRRVGGRGEVEVGEDRQRWIHADPAEGLKDGKTPGGKRAGGEDKQKKPIDHDYKGVYRYEMAAKRIW